MQFGYLLRTLRICAGVSLRELAKTIGVSPAYLSFVETGRQPPPRMERIVQIENALGVPDGSLRSVVHGANNQCILLARQMPEVMDFLSVAARCSLCAEDFMELTAYLNIYGWERMKAGLESAGLLCVECGETEGEANGPYLWPFLDERLIFDVAGGKAKSDFLEEAVSLIAAECEGVDAEAMLRKLLAREKAASTGIGCGVAVPHAYLDGLGHLILSLLRIRDGMNFDSVDGDLASLAMVMVGPRSTGNLQLKLLSRMAKLLSYNRFLEHVLEAEGPKEVVSVFKSAEMKIP